MSRSASRFLRPLLLSSAIALLSACGGGGGDAAPAAPTGSATGVLSDSPVGGVRYTTSSGITGTTDSEGRFSYNPGDSVTFQIGGLSLGTVTVTGTDATITPLQVAEARTDLTEAQRQNLVTNLLVLLQSLDSDGDPANGISIPASVGTALTATAAATLDLVADPDDFVASGTLGSLAGTAGGTVVDPAAALVHFRAQFFKDAAGVYTVNTGENSLIAFRINADGSYLMAEAEQEDEAGKPGIERGWINWDPRSGALSAYAIDLDTNGEWGLSHPRVDERLFLSLDGTRLVVKTDYDDPAAEDEELSLERLQPGSGIVGPWALVRAGAPASSLAVQQFLFLADGRYLMIDPVGDDEYNDTDDLKCGWEGLEFGRYTFVDGVLSTSGVITDTNDCAGLHDSVTGVYTTFDSVSVVAGTLKSGDEVLLVRADVGTPQYVGESTVVSVAEDDPVVQEGATLFCAAPDDLDAVTPLAASLDFNAAAGTFTMTYADEDGLVAVSGSYNPVTGAMSWQETLPREVTLQTESTTFYMDGVLTLSATYNATDDTVSGTATDTVTNTWTRDASSVTCSATSEFSLQRVRPPVL
jgi:hypothetical protein